VARAAAAEPPRPRLRLDGASALRLAIGFALGLAFWFAFSAPYERAVAAAAQGLTRLFERPATTSLEARGGEIRVDRADFPPDSPRPGLPAADLHFNFVLLAALFALTPRPLGGANLARFAAAAAILYLVHVAALCAQLQSLYATSLGPWSDAHYGTTARNLWAGAFHFWQVAGRFAAPFALWWGLGRFELAPRRSKG
jgi:hypothetical protein